MRRRIRIMCNAGSVVLMRRMVGCAAKAEMRSMNRIVFAGSKSLERIGEGVLRGMIERVEMIPPRDRLLR